MAIQGAASDPNSPGTSVFTQLLLPPRRTCNSLTTLMLQQLYLDYSSTAAICRYRFGLQHLIKPGGRRRPHGCEQGLTGRGMVFRRNEHVCKEAASL